MEKTFQMDNVDLKAIHDKIMSEIQSNGLEVHRDEWRDNGFKILVRRGEERGEVEVFNDWGSLRLITRDRLEWDLMNMIEPLMNQGPQSITQQSQNSVPQPPNIQPSPHPQFQQPMNYPKQDQQAYTQQPYQQPQQLPSVVQVPEHQQIVNILMQNNYQIEVNTTNGQTFFVRGRKGNYVIDIEGRPQP
ncbi:hypothetical protein [Acidianus brierleyi]|uniref:Uncharacterized protein n=1 Tax=Acidianus brierleyi TaxID=41673 RepID=A0A2U9IHM2_9CREN|nr:hypothetical protein [Acidianus brierleyi]AWR95475.1 hypothetical protein DFR85_13605 [Acidianus brierleyi]